MIFTEISVVLILVPRLPAAGAAVTVPVRNISVYSKTYENSRPNADYYTHFRPGPVRFRRRALLDIGAGGAEGKGIDFRADPFGNGRSQEKGRSPWHPQSPEGRGRNEGGEQNRQDGIRGQGLPHH